MFSISPAPFPQRTFARPPRRLFGEETPADRTAIIIPMFADRTDREAILEPFPVHLGSPVRDVFGDRLGEVRGHRDLAWQFRFIPLVAAEECQAVAVSAMGDDRPFRVLAEE